MDWASSQPGAVPGSLGNSSLDGSLSHLKGRELPLRGAPEETAMAIAVVGGPHSWG